MRFFGMVLATALLLPAGAAFADAKPPFEVSISAGGGVTYSDDSGVSDVESEEIAAAIGFRAKFDAFSIELNHAWTEDNDDGDEELNTIKLGFSNETCVVDLHLTCNTSVKWQDGDNSTLTYAAGIAREWQMQRGSWEFKPELGLGVKAVTGDRSETILQVSFEVPIQLADHRSWTLTPSASFGYGMESQDTEPNWGIRLEYEVVDNVRIRIGYEGQTSLDENGDYGDTDHSATLRLAYSF